MPERRIPHRRVLAAGLATLILWACKGDNLFEPNQVNPPQIVGLSAPASVRAGQDLDVRVRAIGELRIDSVLVRLRGAYSEDKSIRVTSGTLDVVVDATFSIPAVVSDTILVVSATAVDAQGNASAVAVDSVRVIDSTLPTVSVSLTSDAVGLGKEVGLDISASDNVGLARWGFRILSQAGDTISVELVPVAGSKRDSTFVYVVPRDAGEGDLLVEAIAIDVQGNVSVAQASQPLQVLFIDDEHPFVDIIQPGDGATLPVADSAFVQVLLQDNGGVDSVQIEGVAFRGNPNLGTDTVVVRFVPKGARFQTPTQDTVFTRYLIPTADSTSETAAIIVTAFDTQGNMGADTVALILGGPKVELLNIQDGQFIQPDRSLALRVRATDPQLLLQVQIEVTGVIEQTITQTFNPPVDTVLADTALVIPANVQGEITIVASARNTLDVRGESSPVTLTIAAEGGGDTIAPNLLIGATAPTRMETRDVVFLELSGSDDVQGSGIVRAGYTVLAISPARADTLIQYEEVGFDPPRTGNVNQNFGFEPFNVDSLNLPDTLVFEITGYFFDAEGNCAASVAADTLASLPCAVLPTGEIVADQRPGQRLVRSVVAGRTVRLPQGGLILDAVVDTTRRNLLLSNYSRDRVEVFRLQEERFLSSIRVGSEPWGLSLNRRGDTLLVANSGGTNISNVYLGPSSGLGPALEDNNRRFLTPDVVLFDVERKLDDTGSLRYTAFVIPDALPPGFSDRPQYLAVDSTGRILYSTKTTFLGDFGTMRKAFVPQGATSPEVNIFLSHAPLLTAPDFTALGNIDDIAVALSGPDTFGVQNDQVILTDHVPGFPDQIITGGPGFMEDAVSELEAAGSDIVAGTGRWDVPGIGFADTTFVSASGDGGWVVFGEGSVDPVGRVIMYDASRDVISSVVEVTDLMTNASETVRGVGLNHDGTLGVARGFQAYFYTTDLRQQGVADLPAGGAGAAMHPLHADAQTLDNPSGEYRPDTHLAFLGTGDGTIDIIDTFHFFRAGRIFIRDVVVGPLRAVLPFPEDNAGFQCLSRPVVNQVGEFIGNAVEIFANGNYETPHPAQGGPTEDACVVVKLFGITSSGGVVVVDLRKRDILREHPQRL